MFVMFERKKMIKSLQTILGGDLLNRTQNNGFKFLDFLEVKEDEIYRFQRLAGSYAVIKCEQVFVML